MAEEKDASMDLKSELAELEGLEGNLDTTTDVSADLVEMKNRMDKSDQEMRAMTEAMKSTLLDVRTLMQDMDNPFNMLRDMGVDKLVTKAVETVEEEVNAKKNEDAKNKMAGVEEDGSQNPVVAKIEGSTTNHPGVISTQPPVQAPVAPQPQAQPVVAPESVPVAPKSAPVESVNTPSVSSVPVSSGDPDIASPVTTVHTGGDQAQQLLVQPETATETESVPVTSSKAVPATQPVSAPVYTEAVPQYTHIEERLYQTEDTVNHLANTVGELVKTIRVQRDAPVRNRTYAAPSVESNDFYEAYIGLVSDYMYLRLGDRGAEELLLEGMYKEWASPNVVRDIMDKLSGKKSRRGKSISEEANIEDRMLLTTLLRNLDKPTREWNESTHLFMLMALVSRAKENTA